ncbi:MAG: glycosyltransferase family 39 protein, partial [Eubacterium sp.]|nr:glycosyltransferase family 39 protein [Eubacterium sp.]
ALYSTVKRLTNNVTACGALAALGATYQWVYCIQECSEYGLMLMFLFFAFYTYVRTNEDESLLWEVLFILSCVGAVYSQYGSAFVIVPLLILHFIRKCVLKNLKAILRTTILYVISAVVFAAPLYLFFAREQMERHQIFGGAVKNTLDIDTFQDYFPVVFGKLWAFFLGQPETLAIICSVLGIVILILGIRLLLKKRTDWICRSLVIVLLAAYGLFYILVVNCIYAMVHANQSSGFYSRYAYFFLPAFYIIIPIILFKSFSELKNEKLKRYVPIVFSCVFAGLIFFSYPNLLDNWHKTYEKEMAEIWINNAGFSANTYVLSSPASRAGFDYYTNLYKYRLSGEILTKDDLDLEELDQSFWVWATNWSTEEIWNDILITAKGQGYKVNIYMDNETDYGKQGRLAYFEAAE